MKAPKGYNKKAWALAEVKAIKRMKAFKVLHLSASQMKVLIKQHFNEALWVLIKKGEIK